MRIVDHPRDLIKYILFFIFPYQVGVGLLKIIPAVSAGSIVRNMLPALLVGGVLAVVISLENFPFVNMFLQKPGITVKQAIFIGLIAVPGGMLVPFNCGMMESIVIVMVMAGFSFSLYSILFGKAFYSVVSFLLVLPFLNLIEYWFSAIPLSWKWGFFTLTPTLAFVLITFFTTLIFTRNKDASSSLPISLKWAIFIFVLLSVFSSVVSINPLKSLGAFFLEFIYPLMFFYIVLKNIHEERQVKILTYTMVTSVVIISFINLYFFTRNFGEKYSEITDLDSAFLQGNLHAGSWMNMVIMVLPIAIVLLVLSNNKRLKLIFLGSTILLFTTTILSFVRTAIISDFVLLITLTMAKKLRKIIFIILIIIGIGIIFQKPLLEKYVNYNFIGITSLNDLLHSSSMRYRVNSWIAALKMIKDYPLLGIGPGLWEDYIPSYGVKQIASGASSEIVWDYINEPHNYYIEIAVYSGILGFILWAAILVIIFKNAIRCLRFTKDNSRYYLVLGSIAGLLAYLTWCLLGGGFVDETPSNIGVGIYFFVLAAIIFRLSNFEKAGISKLRNE